ncbi:trans-Golgi network integral membrane protein TGN38 [Agrilus planipennis]|uniref:Trans-Golgi network integral membrane protein TGN38 n=1 Tax=Agrilus planipennis TaxID=224129 RepID=A0A1W4WUL0_AGRPL|nr:trans-Golgi network integral membrane protein TGN38 [Agrilus planipennis]
MYPIWLLAAFFVGTLDCIPVNGISNTCPGIKTSKLVHADFLIGCAKRNTGTVSEKLCILYEEILKQLCTSVKDKKLLFSDSDLEKALQSTDITKVCDVLSTFKLDDVARTREILLPIADHHCFRTCQSDDYKTLPICNYGAYMLNIVNALSSHPALDDSHPKEEKNNTSINTTNTNSFQKTGNNNSKVISHSTSGSSPASNKDTLQLHPTINNKTLSSRNESKPGTSLSSNNITKVVTDEKQTNVAIASDKLNNPNKVSVSNRTGTHGKPLNYSNLDSHGSNPAGKHDQVPSSEGPEKNSQDEKVLHKIQSDRDEVASKVLPDVHVSNPESLGSEILVDPEKAKTDKDAKASKVLPDVHVSNPESLGSEILVDPEKAKTDKDAMTSKVLPDVHTSPESLGSEKPVDPEKQKNQNQKLDELDTNGVVRPQEVVNNNGVSGADDTLKQQNSQGQNKETVSLQGLNTEMVNPQEQLQLEDNDLEDDDNDLQVPSDFNVNSEPIKTTKEVERKPIKTEYSDVDIMPHSFKTENSDDGDSYFFSYFMVICIVFIGGYVVYHNKQRILALIVEGRKGRRGSRSRRPNSANYKKLDSNLEEAISSSCNKGATHVIY